MVPFFLLIGEAFLLLFGPLSSIPQWALFSLFSPGFHRRVKILPCCFREL